MDSIEWNRSIVDDENFTLIHDAVVKKSLPQKSLLSLFFANPTLVIGLKIRMDAIPYLSRPAKASTGCVSSRLHSLQKEHQPNDLV